MSERCSVAVIILTLNEEQSLPQALGSVNGWARQVFVVDSFSTDGTVDIARRMGVKVYVHAFDNFTEQRNWALSNLPIVTDWILFLDADEYVPDRMKSEIYRRLQSVSASVGGFITGMRFVFLGRGLKHGDIYRSLIRLTRRGSASYVHTGGFREKVVVEGRIEKLESYLIHDDKKTLADWIADQSGRIRVDVQERFSAWREGRREYTGHVARGTIEGSRSYWLREKVLMRMPGSVRPFAQFLYRFVFRGGFLDGWPGFVYHFLLQFWYPLMVEAAFREMKMRHKRETGR